MPPDQESDLQTQLRRSQEVLKQVRYRQQADGQRELFAQQDTTGDFGGLTPADSLGLTEQEPDSISSAEPVDQRGFVGKLFASTARGALEAVDETVDFLTPGLDVNLFADSGEDGLVMNLPRAPEGAGWGMVEGFTQFGVGLLGAGKVLKATGLARKATLGTSRLLRGTQAGRTALSGAQRVPGLRHIASSKTVARMVPIEMASAITDAVAFDPYDDRMVDLVSNLTGGRSDAILGWLDADDDTPEALARMQAAVEGGLLGVGLGVTIEGITRSLRIMRLRRQVQAGKVSPEDAQVAAREISDAPFEADDAIAVYHNSDGTLTGRVKQTGEFVSNPLEFLQMAKGRESVVRGLPEDEFDLPVGFMEGEDLFMYHATGAKGAIQDLGLMSGREAQSKGLLGGGGEGISVTYSEAKAQAIANFAEAGARIVRDEVTTPKDLLDKFYWDETIYENPFEFATETGHTFLRNSFDQERADYIMGTMEFEDWVELEGLGSVRSYDDADPMLQEMYDEVTSEDFIMDRLDEVFEQEINKWSGMGLEETMKFRRRWLAEFHKWMDIIQTSDLGRSITDKEGDDLVDAFMDIDPDNVGYVQVAMRRDVPGGWRTGTQDGRFSVTAIDSEFEIQIRDSQHRPSEAVEVIERLDLASEQQAAALNLVMKRKLQGIKDVKPGGIKKAVERVSKALADGEEWTSSRLQSELGLNLGLYVKDYDDFRKVSKAITESFPDYMRAARARAKDGHEASTWGNLVERSQARLANITGTSITDIRKWAEQTVNDDVTLRDADEVIQSSAMMLNFLGQDAATISKAVLAAVDGSPEKGLLTKLQQDVIETFAEIQIRMAGLQSETGRLLNSFKLRGMTPEQYATALKENRARMGLEAIGDTPEIPKHVLDVLAKNMVLTGGDPEQIRKVLMMAAKQMKRSGRSADKMEPWDKINWFRTSMMLSGPKTQVINVVNNAYVAATLPVERIMGGWLGHPSSREFGEHQLKGMMQYLGASFEAARTAWKTGNNVLDPSARIDEGMFNSSLGMQAVGWGPQWFRKAVNIPGRALMAGDEFFKNLNYYGHITATAHEQVGKLADEMGLAGAQRQEFVTNKVADLVDSSIVDEATAEALGLRVGQGMNLDAMDFAEYATFTRDLEGGFGRLQQFVNKHGWARFLMPFVRTPVNLLKYSFERTPLGLLSKEMRADLVGQNGMAKQSMARGRLAVASTIYTGAGMMYFSDRMTGRGPSDYDLNKQWRDAGWQPYSIRVGDKWVSYNRIEPYSTILGTLADFMEVAREEEDRNGLDRMIMSAVVAISGAATEKTFALGLTEFLSAASSRDPQEIEKWIKRTQGSLTPNLANQLNSDPYLREARNMIEVMQRRFDPASRGLEPKRNLFGEKVRKPTMGIGMSIGGFNVADYLNNALNPFTVSDWNATGNKALDRFLLDLGSSMPMPSPTIGELDLRDRNEFDNGTGQSPYDRMLEILGDREALAKQGVNMTLREALTDEFTRNAYGTGTQSDPGGEALIAARTIVSSYVAAAKGIVLEEYPDLLSAYEAQEIEAGEALEQNRKSLISNLR